MLKWHALHNKRKEEALFWKVSLGKGFLNIQRLLKYFVSKNKIHLLSTLFIDPQ